MPFDVARNDLIPEITIAEAASRGYFKPGRLTLTSGQGFAPSGIRFFEALDSGEPAIWQHAMRVWDDKNAISQNWQVEIEPWAAYIGCTIRIWDCSDYSKADIERLLKESKLALGRKYDWMGIIGQILKPLPWVGEFLADFIQFSFRTFCSEFVLIIERLVNRLFMQRYGRCVSPAEINKYCMNASGWTEVTFKLKAA